MSEQGPFTLRDFADAYELHPLWIGVLYELPIERTITPGPSYKGPQPGTWTRQQRASWLRLVEQAADILYTVDEPQLQLPRALEPDRVLGEAEEAPAELPPPPIVDMAEVGVLRDQVEKLEDEAAAAKRELEAERRLAGQTGAVARENFLALSEAQRRITELEEALAPPAPEGSCGRPWVGKHDGVIVAYRCTRPAGHDGAHAADAPPIPEPDAEPEPDPQPAPARPAAPQPVVTDVVPCKIPGCTNTASRRGRRAGRCREHRDEALPANPGGRPSGWGWQPTPGDNEDTTVGDAIPNTQSPDPAQILITKKELEHLTEIVNTRLSPVERSCVVALADGHSYTEIAKRIGQPVKTVDNALQRARKKLSEPIDTAPGAAAPPPDEAVADPHDVIYCPYCRNNRFRSHVDEHVAEVDRERGRQEAERAKISHLSRPTGVGGAA